MGETDTSTANPHRQAASAGATAGRKPSVSPQARRRTSPLGKDHKEEGTVGEKKNLRRSGKISEKDWEAADRIPITRPPFYEAIVSAISKAPVVDVSQQHALAEKGKKKKPATEMERSNAPPAKAARRAEEARCRASDEPAALSNVPPAEAAGPTARAPEPAAADSLHLAEREHPTNFQELPAEARPQSMAGGKHSFTLKKDGSQSRVSVLLRSRAFYVKPALEIAANHGLEIDKHQGSHISWTLYGGAVGAFEVAKKVAGWAP